MIMDISQAEHMLPDFLIVGAPRSGTTTLYAFLSKHRRIFMPAEKEPTFLLAWGEPFFYKDSQFLQYAPHIVYKSEDYFRLFRAADKGDIVGEASSLYLSGHRQVIPNIRRLYGDQSSRVKIIISLRNPAERAWSHYCLKRNYFKESLDFAEAIRPEIVHDRLQRRLLPSFDYIGLGMYSAAVSAYLDNFPSVKILLLEDIAGNLTGTMGSLCSFLGLEADDLKIKTARWNASGLPKNGGGRFIADLFFRPNMLKSVVKPLLPMRFRQRIKFSLGDKVFSRQFLDQETRARLLEIYRDDILRLEKMIGRDLRHWLRPEGSQPEIKWKPDGP